MVMNMTPRPRTPWKIITHPTDEPPTYFIEHPFGGYMQLDRAEVLLATSNGCAVAEKPSKAKWASIEHKITLDG